MNDTYALIASIRSGKLSQRKMRKMLKDVTKQLTRYEKASMLVNYTTADFPDYDLWQKAHKIAGGRQHGLSQSEWLRLAPHQQRSLVFKAIEAIQVGPRSFIDVKDALEAQITSEPNRPWWKIW